jgi:hypothetical protein
MASGNREEYHRAALAVGSRRWIAPWYQYDAFWYADIGARGYSFYRPGEDSPTGFLPLLPLVMRGGAVLGLDPYWVGLIIPNLAFVAGLAFFGRAVLHVTGEVRAAWRACVLLVAFPWSVFFSAPYQESLGFALVAAALLAWLCRAPLRAALALAWATAARMTAVCFSAALVLEWFSDLLHRRHPRSGAWLVAAAGGVGVGLFFFYLYLHFGDPMLHLKSHAARGRKSPSVANIAEVLLESRLVFQPGKWQHAAPPMDYCNLFAFLGLGVHAWWKRGPFWGALVLLPVLQAMASGTVISMTRIVLAAFPGFLDAAELLRHRWAFTTAVVFSALVQAFVLNRIVHGVWIG